MGKLLKNLTKKEIVYAMKHKKYPTLEEAFRLMLRLLKL